MLLFDTPSKVYVRSDSVADPVRFYTGPGSDPSAKPDRIWNLILLTKI
jgi:hypothetical protein